MDNKILTINKRGFVADFSWLSSLESILYHKFRIKRSISIALVSKTEIKRLNKIYRKKDRVTDVLAFNIDSDLILGEIIICLEQAKEQAKERSRTIVSELKLLTIHGILHLFGYNHESSLKKAKEQREAEENILNLLG